MSNYGSISRIIQELIANVPYEKNPHHETLGIGHASMAGKCARQIWLSSHISAEKRKQEPVMLFGQLIHNWFEDKVGSLSEETLKSTVPVDFRPKYNVIGLADFVSEKTVGELKTTKKFALKWLDAPREQHILQASIYAYGLNKPYIEIIYICRDTAEVRPFFWPRLNNIVNEISRISDITTMHVPPEKYTWKGDKLEPARPWNGKLRKNEPWECRYCSFWKECFEIDRASR